MQRILWCSCSVLLFLLMSACSRSELSPSASPDTSGTQPSKGQPAEGPPADVVTVNVPQVDVKAGGDGEALLTVKIADGYHINGNPAAKYQIATTLMIEPAEGITPGEAVYPQPISKKFSFSNEPIAVYESGVVIKQPLRAGTASAKGNHVLRAKLRVQPCDDTVCYPPRNLEVTIPVNVN